MTPYISAFFLKKCLLSVVHCWQGRCRVEDERSDAAPGTFLLQFGETNGCEPVEDDCALILRWNRDDMAMHVKE